MRIGMINIRGNTKADRGTAGCCPTASEEGDQPRAVEKNGTPKEDGHQWVVPVSGMHCGACVSRVEKALLAVPGVRAVEVDLAAGTAVITGEPERVTEDLLRHSIHKAGYGTNEADVCDAATTLEPPRVNKRASVVAGVVAAAAVVGFYLGLITLTSDWFNARAQFFDYRGWVLALAVGLGLQVGLFTHIRRVLAGLRIKGSAKGMAASGSVSGVAMALCCSHYLAAILPAIGLPFLSGAVAGLAQYQTLFFLIGVVSNILGLAYMLRLMVKNGIIDLQPLSMALHWRS